LTRFCRAVFLGAGIDHGDSPPSSANNEEPVTAGAVSSPNKDFEVNGADSGGEEPNKDIVNRNVASATVLVYESDATEAGYRERDLRV
jgi:hypothetical protein